MARRSTHGNSHRGSGALFDQDPTCDALGDDPKKRSGGSRLLLDTLRCQDSLVAEEDVRRYSASSDWLQCTPADDHRRRAGSGMGLRQQPVPLAIESDHHYFPDVQDRCAQKNEARRREARVKQECVYDACARGDLVLMARFGGY